MEKRNTREDFLEYCLTFHSVTYAQRAREALHRAGIRAALRRTPQALARQGCGYCLTLNRDLAAGIRALEQRGMPYSRAYGKTAEGEYREVTP